MSSPSRDNVSTLRAELGEDAGMPEPVNLFAEHAPPIPAFNAQHYPAAIGNLATDVAIRMGVDPCIPAWAAIAAFSGAIDHRHTLRAVPQEPSWLESARLWITLSAVASAKKTPGSKEVLSALSAIEAGDLEAHAASWAEYMLERDVYEQQKKTYIRQKAKGESPQAPKEPTRPPTRGRIIIEDTTVEAAGAIASDNPQGLLLHRDELAGWFSSMGQYKGGRGSDKADWLQAYNGGLHIIDRVTRGAIRVDNWSMSVFGGIQPDRLFEHAPRLVVDGFLQRFLIILCDSARLVLEPPPPSHGVHQAYREALRRAHDMPIQPQPYFVGDEGRAVLNQTRRRIHDLLIGEEHRGPQEAAVAKLEGAFLRLSLLFHMVDYPAEPEVDAETLERAARCVLDFLLPHQSACYQSFGFQTPWDHAKWVAGYILAKKSPGDVLKRSDIYDSYRPFKRARESRPREIDEVMTVLVDAGWLVDDPLGGLAGRWSINPTVWARFPEQVEASKEHRRKSADAIARSKERRRREKELDR